MEEFRQQVVDRTVITLLSNGVIKPDEVLAVERAEEGRVLDRNVVKTIPTSLQERLDTKVMFNSQRAPIKRFIIPKLAELCVFFCMKRVMRHLRWAGKCPTPDFGVPLKLLKAKASLRISGCCGDS